ncbi:adhesion G protein-coupled receptor E3-like [Strongylocentrotus purpuratus]|uniref:Uncharacterized protein n=1 Tax=Strongylocentrotus purpuratus TaxID=7668 RepID=A0A7M7SWW2_STRPU|nr:adhesion G protein-coupled receptor E3-like [Strongylocentrotus purpuratus]
MERLLKISYFILLLCKGVLAGNGEPPVQGTTPALDPTTDTSTVTPNISTTTPVADETTTLPTTISQTSDQATSTPPDSTTPTYTNTGPLMPPDLTTSMSLSSTQLTTSVCGSGASEEAREGLSSGSQQCRLTFTFHFGSVNDRNVTVHHAYTDREDIQDGAEIVKLTDNADENNIVSIISSVIKIELIDGDTTINLSNGSVQITFMMQPTKGFPPTDGSSGVHCAYQVNGSVWSTDGVQVVSVDSDLVVCNSSHLTSFAVLLSLKPPKGVNAQVQSYLSYILGGISIASLVLAVFIYCVTGAWKMLKIQIHMNLAICTALGQILFLSLAEATENRVLCKGVTVTLHYLFTSALAWTMIEGVFLYRTTAVGCKTLRIGWLSLIAYGGSLVVVGVSFGVLFDTYGTSVFCWLHVEDDSIYIFVGCVCATELFSFTVLCFVMKAFSSLKANKKKDEMDKIK